MKAANSKIVKYTAIIVASFIAGIVNALFGTGAGMIFILTLNLINKGAQKEVFASVSVVVLILSVISAFMYAKAGEFSLSESWYYALCGTVGGIVGALLLDKIKAKYLNVILALLLIYCGARMIMR